MIRRFTALAAAAGCLLLAPEPAPAWEAPTTSAGIVEQAALASALHQHLAEQLGQADGAFTMLRVPRADAAPLYTVLEGLNPTHGHVPDSKGIQLALAWLGAGAAIADTPPEFAVHHFYDPTTKRGSSGMGKGLIKQIRHRLASVAVRESLASGGVPAPDWIDSPENPMGLAGFHSQYRKAIRGRTPAERERHAAGALLAAGAILHVLADMASPAHVRDDLASHFERVSGDQTDVGSRFERVAALGFARLGVPRAARVIRKARLRDYFTANDRTGLADVVAAGYFSAGTLPRTIVVKRSDSSTAIANKLADALVRPSPAPAGRLDLDAARTRAGARLESASGTCLAHYHLDGVKLSFSIPDRCAIEQQAELLSLAVSYVAGALDHLFRGGLALEARGQGISINAAGVALGAGRVTAFWDNGLGVRTEYAKLDNVPGATDKASLGQIAAPPKDAKAIAVLFEGNDANGEVISAAITSPWPLPKKK